jgi:hypothetical protein
MMETVVKFKADDGKEFHRVEGAEAHNFFLKVRGVLRNVSGPKWSPGYDGPMPVFEPTLETLCHYRDQVRHLFLDVEPPVPEVVVRERVEVRYRFPHWAAWWALILFGVLIGAVIRSWV